MNEMDILRPFDQLINGSLLHQMHTSFRPWTKEDRLRFLEENPEISGIDRDELLIPSVEEDYDETTGIKTTKYQNDETGEWESISTTFDDEVIKLIDKQKNGIIKTFRTVMSPYDTIDPFNNKIFSFQYKIQELLDTINSKDLPYLTTKGVHHLIITLEEISTFMSHQTPGEPIITESGLQDKKYPELTVSLLAVIDVERIKQLYKELGEVFIQDETDKSKIFTRVFCGVEFPAKEDRIVWKNQRALYYFINQLEGLTFKSLPNLTGQLAFKIPDDKWKWVKNCFIQPKGKELTYISNANKVPGRKTKEEIERIIGSLKL